MDKYVVTNMEKDLFKFFLDFENFRRSEEEKEEEKDPDIMEFKDKISHSSDSKSSLEWRHNYFISRFGMKFPDIPLKDENRNFSHEQRLAIWRRDKKCKLKRNRKGYRTKKLYGFIPELTGIISFSGVLMLVIGILKIAQLKGT